VKRSPSRLSRIIPLWLALGATLQAEPRFPGGYLNDAQPGRVTTPHVEWARPWAPGTIRAFFLSPGYTAPREIIELWQRLDIAYEAVAGITSYDYYDLNRKATDQWARSVIGCNPARRWASYARSWSATTMCMSLPSSIGKPCPSS